MVRDKVYFVSDAHLGSGADSRERERQLCQWLDSIKADCKTLMLLGDIFDFWFSYRYLVPRGHVRLLGKLAELADSGVEIHFFIGNHDMWVFDYLTEEFGAIVHDEPLVMDIDGKRFLIGHGDGLGHIDHWFDFVRFFFRSRFCHKLFKMLPSAFTFGIAHHWSDGNKVKHSKRNMLHYLGDDREGIVIYIKQRLQTEHFDYCVFGHRHTPLVKVIGDQSSSTTVYLNTGDWFHNRNFAVYTPGGSLQLHDFDPSQV
ncbi:MAG: UDP-2,3-diacylglucosamine diphosphatase [bacterium]